MGLEIVLLVAVAGAGLRLATLHARLRALEAQAITDPLTGAFNRRHLQVTLAAAVERRRRCGEPASLLLIDIDRFKQVNDIHGHAEGDRILRELAGLLRQRQRAVDALFRVGGDEFALLLAGATLDGACDVAEALGRLVTGADLGRGSGLSISVGVVELMPGHSVISWMADGDAALYRAKRAGRNRVAAKWSARALALAPSRPR